jgi:AcrR family transcriptional regulator
MRGTEAAADDAVPGEQGRAATVQPTSARGQRTRAALVEGARAVFSELGYADANATTITKAAGVSYGSFYVYFSSKEEIFIEIARELFERVYVESRAPKDVVDPRQRLAFENARYFELYRENVGLFRAVEDSVRTDASLREVWTQMHYKYLGRVSRSLRRLQDDGRATADFDPDHVAEILGAMVERLAYLSTIDDALDVDALQRTIAQVWGRILGLSPEV